jgi:N-acetylneuraminic acid mutarotase
MSTARDLHTATLLPNGKVLVVGGDNGSVRLSTAELFDPASGAWTSAGTMHMAREGPTATLLANGKVLVAGGFSGNGDSGYISAELYDPSSGTWSVTGSPGPHSFSRHTATLLPSGAVLLAGGDYSDGATISSGAFLYDPVSGTWTPTGSMNAARYCYTATLLPNGKVLAAGGDNLGGAEVYDFHTGAWTSTGSMSSERFDHSATLLPNGKVLVTGGSSVAPGPFLSSAEIYDPASGSWSMTSMAMSTARAVQGATLLTSGQVLIAGGANSGGVNVLSSAELYDFAAGGWTSTGALGAGRDDHRATLLTSGKVLVSGGDVTGRSAELYDPSSRTWTPTTSMNVGRYGGTATLLPNGQVLVAGGGAVDNSVLAVAELYDPQKTTWTPTGSLNTARSGHMATLLPNGKVLVSGGYDLNFNVISSAEVYDPSTGIWNLTGSMSVVREGHTATLLPDGDVLVAGGEDGNGNYYSSAELYHPVSGTWSQTAAMSNARGFNTATLLPNGKVLVAGGNAIGSAELYDSSSSTWTTTGSLNTPRDSHTATLLMNGKVLVAGGEGNLGNVLASAELYDPALGAWSITGPLNIAREFYTATLLPDGKVLAAGGYSGLSSLSSAELYDAGLAFNSTWQPEIDSINSPFSVGGTLALSALPFTLRGISEASGGNTQNSSTDYPLVQLRSLANEQTLFLVATNWGATFFDSAPLGRFPPGYLLVTAFVNAIPSTSVIGTFAVNAPILSIGLSAGNAVLNWSTNYPGYAVESTPSLNPATWTVVPGTASIMNGQYVVSVPLTTGNLFFRLVPYAGGSALTFDGSSSYVSIGAGPIAPPWTAEFWVNRQDAPNYSASLVGDGATALKLEQFNFTRRVGFTQFGVADYTFNYSAPANTWVHLAFVCDTSTRLYVNGVLQDSNPATISLPRGRLGFDSSGAPDYMRGTIDEVRVWNVVRTPAQIQANMNHPLAVPQANLVGYWRLDEGSLTTAFDSSGSGKTGTLQNSTAWVNSTAPIVP